MVHERVKSGFAFPSRGTVAETAGYLSKSVFSFLRENWGSGLHRIKTTF